VVAGAALAAAGLAATWLSPTTPLPALLGVYVLFGIFLGTINPPITTSAVSGMPVSMAGVAAAIASASRQFGITLGVAMSGSIVGAATARGGPAFTEATHTVWWIVAGLGLVIVALGWITTTRRALAGAQRTAALFDGGHQP
jgi:hypothetical protein